MSILAAFLAGGVFAHEHAGRGEIGGAFTAIGGGVMADASRTGESVDYRFWSQIYAGPWFFLDAGDFEFSAGLAVGRIARRNRWCFLLVAANAGLLWRAPFDFLGITPLFGAGIDAIIWVLEECLRSDAVVSESIPGGRAFVNFSSLKLKTGLGRDFDFRNDRFFRVRALGYYGRRWGNPNPWGGSLRIGGGRRL